MVHREEACVLAPVQAAPRKIPQKWPQAGSPLSLSLIGLCVPDLEGGLVFYLPRTPTPLQLRLPGTLCRSAERLLDHSTQTQDALNTGPALSLVVWGQAVGMGCVKAGARCSGNTPCTQLQPTKRLLVKLRLKGHFGSLPGGPGGEGLFDRRNSKCESQQMLPAK